MCRKSNLVSWMFVSQQLRLLQPLKSYFYYKTHNWCRKYFVRMINCLMPKGNSNFEFHGLLWSIIKRLFVPINWLILTSMLTTQHVNVPLISLLCVEMTITYWIQYWKSSSYDLYQQSNKLQALGNVSIQVYTCGQLLTCHSHPLCLFPLSLHRKPNNR